MNRRRSGIPCDPMTACGAHTGKTVGLLHNVDLHAVAPGPHESLECLARYAATNRLLVDMRDGQQAGRGAAKKYLVGVPQLLGSQVPTHPGYVQLVGNLAQNGDAYAGQDLLAAGRDQSLLSRVHHDVGC